MVCDEPISGWWNIWRNELIVWSLYFFFFKVRLFLELDLERERLIDRFPPFIGWSYCLLRVSGTHFPSLYL